MYDLISWDHSIIPSVHFLHIYVIKSDFVNYSFAIVYLFTIIAI